MPDIWMDVDAAVTVPCNILPLIDPTDFKSVEEAIAYNESGIEVIWHFVTTAGVQTSYAITPTTGGVYDWSHVDGGIYKIEIPASGGGSANNDTEGFGWITGKTDNCLPFRGPIIGFRAAELNNLLIDNAYSATRGLAGTALPDAVAGANGGVPLGDANARVDVGKWLGSVVTKSGANLPYVSVQEWNDVTLSSTNPLPNAAPGANNGLPVLGIGAGLVNGTIDTTGFAATTTEFESDDITTAAADFYNGRVIVFLTGSLAGQATLITDYVLTGGRGHFTVNALTSAPGNNDTFRIY